MALDDTRPEVRRLQTELLRRLGPTGRLELAREACESVHRAQLAGLRQRHPDLDEAELDFRARVLRAGRELVLRAFGGRLPFPLDERPLP